MPTKVSPGTVHSMPADMRAAILANPKIHAAWERCTPLCRNEFICWTTSGKLTETRVQRIAVAKSKLLAGERRPCCWAGCPHREKKKNSD